MCVTHTQHLKPSPYGKINGKTQSISIHTYSWGSLLPTASGKCLEGFNF
jgi:hypothetical protein